MSDGQRGRNYHTKRKNYFRHNDFQRRRVEEYLEAGLKGFICTCNFNEEQCKREAYNILNEYSESQEIESPATSLNDCEEDIEYSLNKEVNELKAQASRGSKLMKFQNVKTGAKNCLFVRTTIQDPVQLVVKVLEDIETSRKPKSRYLLRMLPIEVTCKATVNSMEEAFKPIAKKHFSSEGKTFSVMYRARCNSSVSRDEVIDLLAGIVKAAHPLNRADLSSPQLAVLVEIIKGICCIGVVPRYNELKRYNLHELARPIGGEGEGSAANQEEVGGGVGEEVGEGGGGEEVGGGGGVGEEEEVGGGGKEEATSCQEGLESEGKASQVAQAEA